MTPITYSYYIPALIVQDHLKAMAVGEGSALGTYEPGTRQEETALRGYLSGFGLNAYKAVIPVKHLSGGQRMRVAMVRHSVLCMCFMFLYLYCVYV